MKKLALLIVILACVIVFCPALAPAGGTSSKWPVGGSQVMAKSAADGSLTFVKSAEPRDGTDFTFLFSTPIIPHAPAFLTEWGSQGSGEVQFKYPQKVLAFLFFLDDANPDDGDAFGSSITFDESPGTYYVAESAPSGWGLDSLTCTGASASQVNIDLPQLEVTIDLAAGEHITCTFANSLLDYPSERAALMSLYDSTGGEYWFENEGWGSNSSYCTWFGVTCDLEGHVLHLDLPDNSLDGPIPSEIDDLVKLQKLDLSGNGLEGPIPDELGNLAFLQALDLSDSRICGKYCARTLGGAIPASLGKLSSLKTLDLSNNKLTGAIPAKLGDLAGLQTLDLSYNTWCRTYPPDPPDYEVIVICSGGLSGAIPAELSSLSELIALGLQGNKKLCWETTTALYWALALPSYSGPASDCSVRLPIVLDNR